MLLNSIPAWLIVSRTCGSCQNTALTRQESVKEQRGKIKNRRADIPGCSSVLLGGGGRGKVRRSYMSSDLQSVMVDYEVVA